LGAFQINGTRALFIFANLNGTISGWNPTAGTTAVVTAPSQGAVYTGLAMSANLSDPELFAADNKNAKIDAFDSAFAPLILPAGAFDTPAAIAAMGLRPFNVQDLGGKVYVTYALQNDDDAVAGQGAVAEFNEDGTLVTTIVGGLLASPWGLAWAPAGFGKFGGDLMIANESSEDPGISAWNPVTGLFDGSISIDPGAGNEVGAIWGITFGFGNNGGDPNTLYFVDGLNDERDGLFGAITTPEPSTWSMLLAGFAGLGFVGYCKARKSTGPRSGSVSQDAN
jgi:uncharacterized protein (TIGR03118 family)